MLKKSDILFSRTFRRRTNKAPPMQMEGEKGGVQTGLSVSSPPAFPQKAARKISDFKNNTLLAIKKNTQEKTDTTLHILQKLNQINDAADSVLLKVKSSFPFQFFPQQLIIDLHKVTILYTSFFSANTIQNIFYKDIGSVTIETGPFFAKLKIINRISVQAPIIIEYLKKKDAFLAQKIIQGLLTVDRSGIDLSELEDYEIASQLEQIGKLRLKAE